MIVEHRTSSPAQTEELAARLSLWAGPGQCILLSGELGSGKSTFARGFIRALAGNQADFDIPSPSFSLVQTYENTRVPVAHADFYRLRSAAEIEELGLEEILASSVVLIEWPERMANPLSNNWLTIHFSGSGQQRQLKLEAHGDWALHFSRNDKIEAFIAAGAMRGAVRSFAQGDASARRYEQLKLGSRSVLLMDMPQRTDGPIVKDNKPYSAIAHLAEGLKSVVAVNDYLFGLGYSTAEIHEVDLDKGLALIEHLGDDVFNLMTARGSDMSEPLGCAIGVLADMAHRNWPRAVPLRNVGPYELPEYDGSAMEIEVDLLLSWYWLHVKGEPPDGQISADFRGLWQGLFCLAKAENPIWTLRDFHSPNLLWLPEREGIRRVGMIDTQDCVLGHPAYDVASLLQDARVDVEAGLADTLLDHYCHLRSAAGTFDVGEFQQAYAMMGAQRATKILGIFARLSARDGKHGYLQHMPRVRRYLAGNLNHPALAPLRVWYERHFPELWGAGTP